MDEPSTPAVPKWKIVAAFILDFFTVAVIGSYVIGLIASLLTTRGITLPPAAVFLLLIAAIVGYFVISGPAFGGTFWQRILKTRLRRQ